MSRRRFIADAVSGDRATLLDAHAAHLSRVLRVRIGEEFDIAANGRVRRGAVIGVEEDRVEFKLLEDVPSHAIPPVTVYLAVIKFDRMEWAIEKCVELGAARLVPLIAARCDVHLVSAAEKRVERWRRLALQASEQSRRSSPPEVAAPLRLKRDVLEVEGTRIVLAESESRCSLRAALERDSSAGAPGPSAVTLAVGPEGGWTEAEGNVFSESGWTKASLGPTILRTETAAIAALSIALLWNDLSG